VQEEIRLGRVPLTEVLILGCPVEPDGVAALEAQVITHFGEVEGDQHFVYWAARRQFVGQGCAPDVVVAPGDRAADAAGEHAERNEQ
jgi:hypothetical protein